MARANADNEGLQKGLRMSQEDRSRLARDEMVKDLIDFHKEQGQEMTETEAREKVKKIADVVESRRDLGEIEA